MSTSNPALLSDDLYARPTPLVEKFVKGQTVALSLRKPISQNFV